MEDGEKASSDGNSKDECTSNEEIIEPPEFRELPQRATRGRRFKTLEGSEAELDEEFWGNSTWQEEQNDEEWSTENEGHYRDEFDSDFFDYTDGEEEDALVQASAHELDKKLLKTERKTKGFDYNRVAQRRAERELRTRSKAWSVLSVRSSGLKDRRGGKQDKRLWSQEDHMKEAQKTEATNLRILEREAEELEEMKLRANLQPTNKAEDAAKGPIDLWISWSSDRTIEAEERRKSERQREREALSPPHERQLLLFLNPANPPAAAIANIYLQPSLAKNKEQNLPPYMDPITRKRYHTLAQFQAIRKKTIDEESNSLSRIVAKHTPADH